MKIPIKYKKLILEGNFLPLYVILRREYAHPKHKKTLKRVGPRPLVFSIITILSGIHPTLFTVNLNFGWGTLGHTGAHPTTHDRTRPHPPTILKHTALAPSHTSTHSHRDSLYSPTMNCSFLLESSSLYIGSPPLCSSLT